MKAAKDAVSNKYIVWATSKKSGLSSNEIEITVTGASGIKTIKARKGSITQYRVNLYDEFKIFENIEATGAYSSEKEDFRVTTSDSSVVSVGNKPYFDGDGNPIGEMWYGKLEKPGKATITVWAADGSGLKTSFTVSVVQKARDLIIDTTSYMKVVQGKSITLSSYTLPADAAVKQATRWQLLDYAKNPLTDKNITISNKGVVKTTKNALVGDYYVMAWAKNPDGTEVAATEQHLVVTPSGYLVNKIEKGPGLETVIAYTAKTAFFPSWKTDTKVLLGFNVTGGEPDLSNLGWPMIDLFEVTSSNENILKVVNFERATYEQGQFIVTVEPTGKGTGTVMINIRALDGSNAKSSCKVIVDNPVSSLEIAPEKAGQALAVGVGKKIKLNAVIGEEYGKVKEKNIEWSLTPPFNTYINIDPKTGVLTINKNYNNYIPAGSTYREIEVKAEEKYGFASTTTKVRVYKDCGKMYFCNSSYKKLKNSGAMCNNYGEPTNSPYIVTEYIMFSKSESGAYIKADKGEVMVSSSNPSVATITNPVFVSDTDNPEYALYRVDFICQMPHDQNKAGSTKFTISTIDGAQKLTYNLKITKR